MASLVVFLTTFKHSITKFKSHYHSSLESVAGLAHRVNPGVVELPSPQQVYLACAYDLHWKRCGVETTELEMM